MFSDINCDAFGHTCFIQLYVEGTEGMPEDNQKNAKKKQKIYERGGQQ